MRMYQRPSRTTTARRRVGAAVLLAGAALLAGAPSAAAQDLPDVVDDPVEAVEPLEPRPEPVAPRPEPEPGPGPVPAGPGPEVAVIAGVAEATAGPAGPAGSARPATPAPRVAGAAAMPDPAPIPTGQLPFTGADSSQIILALLVGSLLVSSGLVAVAYGRAADDAA